MEPALATLLLVAAATAIGIGVRWSNGRLVRARRRTPQVPSLPGVSDAAAVTLLQFSTPACGPCATTRQLLRGIAEANSSVAHVELDVADHPEVASQLQIMQTPTTLIVDRTGTVLARIGGAPRSAELRAEIDRILAA